ncbi:MAG TPA: ABC transporter ATP-binding protein [Candidatus Dormibacteraeota bacterium]|nr:ABC transporter ATP-binding protein [Candidatus Dormibacteraeota bacterium]
MATTLVAAGLTRRHRGGGGVSGIDLELGAGELVAVVGPNGSGKTTLLRMLATVDAAAGGTARWFGSSDRRSPRVRRRIGTVLDGTPHFEEMTGYQNVWFFARRFGLSETEARTRLNVLLSWADLGAAVHRRVREYSLGMRQRLALVEALAHAPGLLVLDEPTLGLDWTGSLGLVETIERQRKAGAAVVVATNDVHLAERLGGRILFLDGGRRVGEGTVSELLSGLGQSQRVELTFRSPVSLEHLIALPGVCGGESSPLSVRLLVDPGVDPARLLGELDGAHRLLTGLEIHRPDLGDAFLQITGRPIEAVR